jgi:hypothetical protein
MPRSVLRSALLILLLGGCAQDAEVPAPAAAPPIDLQAMAAAHYEGYGQALANGQRSAIPGFYHPDGALIVFNGEPQRVSQADLRERYEVAWIPPAWFTWEDLRFVSLGADKLIVTGGFRWLTAGEADTARFIYAAVLVASDTGMAIIFEHETLRP